MSTALAIFCALVVLYGALAVRLGRFSITMPIVFVIVGALMGSKGFVSASTAELLIEMTLALLLFADASTLAFRQVRDDPGPPARLLLIAMPLVIALGGLVAYGLFPGEGFGFALLLATILAPTDAALGLPIFSNPLVPVRIRRALNVESGLNDGIATPFVALFTAMALAYETTQGPGVWLLSALSEIGIGVGAGVAAGLLGGWLFAAAVRRGWTAATGEQIGNLALALCAFWAHSHRVHRDQRHRAVAVRVDSFRRQPGAAPAANVHPAGAPVCRAQPDGRPHDPGGHLYDRHGPAAGHDPHRGLVRAAWPGLGRLCLDGLRGFPRGRPGL
jgi:NhaP-type Na+/H+ or K+/H+ antiporter